MKELRRTCCEEIEQTRRAKSEELSMQQERNPTTVSQLLAQIRDLQNKVYSWSDEREFYDPESGRSSGATHVPSQPSSILSPRTMPRCDSGLPHDTRNIIGTSRNVSERPPAHEGRSSTVFNNSKNSSSSSQDMRPDISETARREMKSEPLNTPIQSPPIQSRSGILDHTGGTHSHVDMMDYPRLPITEWNLGKNPDSMEFQSLKLKFKTEICSRRADPQITSHWIKEVEIAKSIDELMTSRSIFDMLDAMNALALKKLINTQSTFRKRVSVEEQRAQNSDRFSRGRQIAYMIFQYFRATGAYETVQGLSDLFTMNLQNDNVQDFDVRWDQASLSVS